MENYYADILYRLFTFSFSFCQDIEQCGVKPITEKELGLAAYIEATGPLCNLTNEGYMLRISCLHGTFHNFLTYHQLYIDNGHPKLFINEMNDQVYGCITGQLLFWQLATHLHCKCACNLVHKAEMFTAKGDLLGNSAVQSFSHLIYISTRR